MTFLINKIALLHQQLKTRPSLALGLSASIAVAIIILSLTPMDELPAFPGTDKTHHIIAYAFLALPTALAIPHRIIIFAMIYIFLGGAIELIQPYINRYGEWLDFAANITGVMLGTFISLALTKVVSKTPAPESTPD